MNMRVWQLNHAEPTAEAALGAAGYGPLLARVLAARGYATPQQAAALLEETTPLSDPFLLQDMDKAVARIQRAIEQEEPIVIFGDYDVDGVTATAILYEYLSSQGAQVRCKLPSREGGGYGIDKDTLQKLAEKGYTLVVTVDNGISAVEEAAFAASLGIDLVITDHHLPPKTLPAAVAVVDPSRADDASPCKALCGAGVAFKLCAALEGCDPAELLDLFGDLAAIGTVADMVPLQGENRTLVRAGLELLQDSVRPGLVALLEVAGLGGKTITSENISFGMAPRLNSAGRMDSAAVALKLLLCSDEGQATGIAARLTEMNTQRQETEQKIFAAALQKLAAEPERACDRVLVVAGEGWHPGVIGIVASRLLERLGRPAIVISLQNGEGRGSGRAPTGFDLHGGLTACAGSLLRYGGHSAAAGLLIEEEKIAAFRQEINEWAARKYPIPQPPQLAVDAVASLAELSLSAVRELEKLAPFGGGNHAPLFLLSGVAVDGIWPLGAEGRHTRLRLRVGQASCFVSWFGRKPEELAYRVGDVVDAVVGLSMFESRNGPVVSVHLKDIRPAGMGNEPAQQAALVDALRAGATLSAQELAEVFPRREDTVALYRLVREGNIRVDDSQPALATLGAQNSGKTLVSLLALSELGLVERQNGRYLATPVTEKKDLGSAPILKKIMRLRQSALQAEPTAPQPGMADQSAGSERAPVQEKSTAEAILLENAAVLPQPAKSLQEPRGVDEPTVEAEPKAADAAETEPKPQSQKTTKPSESLQQPEKTETPAPAKKPHASRKKAAAKTQE